MHEALSLIPALVKATGKRSLHFKLNVFNQHVKKFFKLYYSRMTCHQIESCIHSIYCSLSAQSSDCTILGKSRCSQPVALEQHPVLQLHMHYVVCTDESAAVLCHSHQGPLSLFLCVNIFSYTNPTVTIAYHIQHSNMLYS